MASSVRISVRATISTRVDAVVAYCSKLFTLEPGDVIAMGSGPGNAAHWDGAYLVPGDVMRVEIEGLGVQENRIVAEAAA